MNDSPMAEEYRRIARQIGESLRFMENLMGVHPGELHWIDFFTSHEGLHLPYEQAQTRQVPRQEGWYNLVHAFPLDRDAHGRSATARTSSTSAAFAIPIGGEGRTGDDARGRSESSSRSCTRRTNPGRLTLIHRFGSGLHRAVPAAADRGRAGHRQDRAVVLRSRCTATPRTTADGIKTRNFEEILERSSTRPSTSMRRAATGWAASISS